MQGPITPETAQVSQIVHDDRLVAYAGFTFIAAETAESEPTPVLLTYTDFVRIAADKSVRDVVATRVWHAAMSTINYMHSNETRVLSGEAPAYCYVNDDDPSIDLRELLAAFREVEAGEIIAGRSLGKTGWNLLVSIINEQLAPDDAQRPLLLPFDETIHPTLFGLASTPYAQQQKQLAAQALEAQYQSLLA